MDGINLVLWCKKCAGITEKRSIGTIDYDWCSTCKKEIRKEGEESYMIKFFATLEYLGTKIIWEDKQQTE